MNYQERRASVHGDSPDRSPRVLILTLFHGNYNYGGVLQAYALYSFLTDRGYCCEELRYADSRTMRHQVGYMLRKGLRNPLAFARQKVGNRLARQGYVSRFPEQPTRSSFDRFVNSEFRTTPPLGDDALSSLAGAYDWYIVGGDQVWNPAWSTSAFFLGFAGSDARRIAYSCSIGKESLTAREATRIANGLSEFDAVSVREDEARELLAGLGVNAVQIADPVFLLSREEWLRVAGVRFSESEPYVFSYLLGEGYEAREQARLFADANGLRLVTIPHVHGRLNPNDIGFADVEVMDATPTDFVNLVANAQFVITDSFHGTALSLLLGTPFYCFSRFDKRDPDSQDSRLRSLLRQFGLESRMLDVRCLGRSPIVPIDSKSIEDICWRLRDEASGYLLTALER